MGSFARIGAGNGLGIRFSPDKELTEIRRVPKWNSRVWGADFK